MKRAWILTLCVSIWIGCAGLGAPPSWVNGEEPAAYPKREFMTAIGTGATLEAAQIAAKGELSRIFSSDLRSEVELIEEETVTAGGTQQASQMLVDTRITSEIELQGAEVPLHWRDDRTAEVWAMAVLERRKECLRIRSEGRDLVTRLADLRSDAEAARNPLLGVRASASALRVGVALDGLQARSRVLGTACLPERPVSTGMLRSDLDGKLARLSFVVKAEDVDVKSGNPLGPLPQLREQIAGNLTRMGLQVGPAIGADVIPIRARVRIQRVQRGTDWAEYRWEGSAEIASPDPNDPALVVAESDGAESHPEPSTARLRARRKAEQTLSDKLDRRLREFLDGAIAP